MTSTQNIDHWREWINGREVAARSIVLLEPGRKGPGYDDWQNKELALPTVRSWAKAGKDAGLKCAHYPTLDVDCDDPDVTRIVRTELEAVYGQGSFWDRRRSAQGVNRFAAIFRGVAEGRKQVRVFDLPDGTRFKLEFLGDGQQVKIIGTHDTPNGGRYYVTDEGYPIRAFDLAEMGGADERAALLDRLEARLIAELGAVRTKASVTVGGVRRYLRAGALEDLDPENQTWDERRLRELVAALPANDFDDYDDAFKVCTAIWGACGGADFGLEIWREWAQSGSWAGANDDKWCEDRWNSIQEAANALKELRGMVSNYGGTVGASARDTFIQAEVTPGMSLDDAMEEQGILGGGRADAKMAERSAPMRDQIVDDPMGAALGWPTVGAVPKLRDYGNLPDALHGMVFRVEDGTLYERATLVPQGGRGWANAAAVLKSRFGNDPCLEYVAGQDKDKNDIIKKTPLHEYLASRREIIRVDTFGYFPGAPELYRDGKGRLVLNQWRAPVVVKDAMTKAVAKKVKPDDGHLSGSLFGQLSRVLFESMSAREDNWEWMWGVYLDWAALVVCAPMIKPGHHYLFTGGQGIGKSLLADILSRMVGHVNRSDVTADTLTNGFGDFLKARLITVDELYTVSGGMNRTGHSAYNSMKTYMAKTPEELWLNIKTKAPETAANLSAWQMSSNSTAHDLRLDQDDRRIAVVGCEDMTAAQYQAGQAVCAQIGVLKDRGFGSAWHETMARAFVARFLAVLEDAGRMDAVLGAAPASNTKAALAMENLSPLADYVLRVWEAGGLPDVVSVEDVQRVCAGRKDVGHGVLNALSAPIHVARALEELGAARGPRVRVGDGSAGVKRRVRAYAMPGGANDCPAVDGVARSARELVEAMREWRLEWGDRTNAAWSQEYEAALERWNN